MLIQVRTKDDLLALIAAGKTGDWRVAQTREKNLTRLQVVNFAGTEMFEADITGFSKISGYPTRRVEIIFINPTAITPCTITFSSRNPVR
jgi:hypothetical protein